MPQALQYISLLLLSLRQSGVDVHWQLTHLLTSGLWDWVGVRGERVDALESRASLWILMLNGPRLGMLLNT